MSESSSGEISVGVMEQFNIIKLLSVIQLQQIMLKYVL